MNDGPWLPDFLVQANCFKYNQGTHWPAVSTPCPFTIILSNVQGAWEFLIGILKDNEFSPELELAECVFLIMTIWGL